MIHMYHLTSLTLPMGSDSITYGVAMRLGEFSLRVRLPDSYLLQLRGLLSSASCSPPHPTLERPTLADKWILPNTTHHVRRTATRQLGLRFLTGTVRQSLNDRLRQPFAEY